MVNFFSRPKPLVLLIADGLGVAPPGPGNAVTLANTPFLDKYWNKYPHTHLKAAEIDVGLPYGSNGNCESGHKNLGAGRTVYENLPLIDKSIRDKSFFHNPILEKAYKHYIENESKIHIIGLVGGGQKHSSINHFMAINKFFADKEIDQDDLNLHIITDGVDSDPKSAAEYIQQVELNMENNYIGKVATMIGRKYVLGKDNNWDNIKIAYKLMTQHQGLEAKSWQEALENTYKINSDDSEVKPYIIINKGAHPDKIKENDVVIFANYESSGSEKLSRAFMDEVFMDFERLLINNLMFIGMTEYARGIPEYQIFPKINIDQTLGEVISQNNLTQLRIASSLRIKHVTEYFDNGNTGNLPGEDRIEIPRIDETIKPQDQPEMSIPLITDLVLQKIDENTYDFIVINLHNVDIVGHTGILDASIKAVEKMDESIGRIITKVLEKNGALVFTSDHGNTEELVNKKGGLDTTNSTNPVPFLLIKEDLENRELQVGTLADVAPTILGLMGIEIPFQMTGRNLMN